MEFTPKPLARFSKLIYRARKASGEFEFSISHLENQSVDAGSVYSVQGETDGKSEPRGPLESLCILLACLGVRLGGGAGLFLILILLLRRAAVPAHGTKAGGGKQVLGEGDRVFVLHMAEGQ